MSAQEDLLAMGFDPSDIEKAISSTDGTVEQCIDWIDRYQNGAGAAETTPVSAPVNPTIDPSLPTEERLRIRKEQAAKKKAEEEKQQRMSRLDIAKHQAEADRVRQDLQIEQAKKDAAARKREAVEDRQYREQLRKRIAQDRLERESREREAQRAKQGIQEAASTAPAAAATAKKPTTVRMRIKYGAKTITKSVDPSLTVEDLGEELAPELELAPGTFELETAYPKSIVAVVANTASVVDAGLSNASITVKLL